MQGRDQGPNHRLERVCESRHVGALDLLLRHEVPALCVEELHHDFQRAGQLPHAAGYDVVGTDFAAVREAMGAGKAHIGWLNTFNYILAAEKYGVDAGMVTERFGSTSYAGQLNVGADSGITTLEDLKGKVMCWVDPNSTSGYIIPRIMLQANGIDPDSDFAQTIETGSHPNVVTAVYNGDCDVGASYADARSSIEDDYPDVKDVVAVLATTTDIPNDSVSFISDMDEEIRADIVAALVEIAASEEGQEALNNLYSIGGLEEASDSFYDGFRADLSKAGMDIEDLAK